LVAMNKPRKCLTHPEIVAIAVEYRAMPREKQWQGQRPFLCALR